MERNYTPTTKNKSKEKRDARHQQTKSDLEALFKQADEIYIDVSMLLNGGMPSFVQNGSRALIQTGKKITIAKPVIEKLKKYANTLPEYVGASQYKRDKNALVRISALVGEFSLSFFAEAGLLEYLDYEYTCEGEDTEVSTLCHIIKQKCALNKRLIVISSNKALIAMLKDIDKDLLSVYTDISMDYGMLYKSPYIPQSQNLIRFDINKVVRHSDCIYIDTCSLMHSGAPQFVYDLLGEMETINSSGIYSKRQLRIIDNVAAELNHHVTGSRMIDKRLSAYRGMLTLRELFAHVNSIPTKDACITYIDTSTIYCSSTDRNSNHADKSFTGIALSESDNSNLVFITQDSTLTQDINDIAHTKSTNKKPITVCMLSSDGTLIQQSDNVTPGVAEIFGISLPKPLIEEPNRKTAELPVRKDTPKRKAVGVPARKDTPKRRNSVVPEKSFSRALLGEYKIKMGDLTIPQDAGFTTVTALAEVNMVRVYIPEGVKKINIMAFKSCESLKQVALPHSLTEIGSSAFVGCIALESIKIPPLVKVLPGSTFMNCTKLSKVILNEGLTKIHANAFTNCTSLTDLYIPKSVIGISPLAFTGCHITIHCASDSAAYRFAKDNGFAVVIE